MKNTDLTPLVEIAISILSVIATYFIIPLLKERLSAEKLDKLVKYTKIAVEAAEQLYGSGTGQQKKEYVVSFLLSKGIVFDTQEVSAIIESAVYRLPEWLAEQLATNETTERRNPEKMVQAK